MRKPVLPVLFLMLAFPLFSIAQVAATTVVAEIPFNFQVGKELLQAGSYRFNYSNRTRNLTLTDTNSGQSIVVPVLTRISPRTDTQVFFDKDDNNYYLSELHISGSDGFHFAGAPGPHMHVGVSGRR